MSTSVVANHNASFLQVTEALFEVPTESLETKAYKMPAVLKVRHITLHIFYRTEEEEAIA